MAEINLDFTDFFRSIDMSEFSEGRPFASTQFGNLVIANRMDRGWPDISECNFALIGVQEDRLSVGNQGCAKCPDEIRKQLYRLYQGDWNVKFADLGNIFPGETPKDTDYAIKTVIGALLRANIIPIVIGGGHNLTYAQYLGYESIEQTINLVSVDPRFDLGVGSDEYNSQAWLNKIILHQPNFLFNFSAIGYQTYFVEQSAIELMGKLNFDVHRLGVCRENLANVEPIIRNADLFSFDISAIRRSDAPGCGFSSANGFTGDEACQLARYAGISDKCTSFGIYELNPVIDHNGTTSELAAQMIWCFVDGFYNRKKDFPFSDTSSYTRFRVFLKDHKHEIIFFKSNRSDRWWMEVPYPNSQKIRFERHALVPCTYDDYQQACEEEMPDKWWQTFQKLS
jgi:arginase family enzyme